MKTYYYVPTDEEVEPHVAEAAMWGIPIVHKIPEFQGVALADSEINVGTHQAVIWSNEFLDLRGKATISVFNARKKEMAYEDLIPVWSEKHRARWVFPILNIGKYEVSLLHDGEKLATALFFAFKRKAAFKSGNKK